MNRHAYILSVALSCAGATTAYAAVPVQGDPQTPRGGDNFNDNTRSPINWGASTAQGAGTLAIADGRLEYTTAGTPLGTAGSPDFAAWDWNDYSGAANQSWAFQMDVSMPVLGLTDAGQSVLFGVQIPEAAGIFFFYLNEFWNGTGESRRFLAQGPGMNEVFAAPASFALNSIRLRYDAAQGTMNADYLLNGAWTNLDSFSAGGAGTISVFGESFGIAVAASQNVFADNVAAVPEPSTYALMVAGLAAVGLLLRRRRGPLERSRSMPEHNPKSS